MRQVMNANIGFCWYAFDTIRLQNGTAVYGWNEINRATPKQSMVRLGPIKRTLIVGAKDVMAQWNGENLRVRRGHGAPQIWPGFRRQYLIVVKKQNPVMPTQGKRI